MQCGAIPVQLENSVAVGPGPRWFRLVLVGVAVVYFLGLVKHPPQWRGLRVAGFFTESTCLFPRANVFASDFRLSAWSCAAIHWKPLDPRAYFPIEADDKESRFQRFAFFYQKSRVGMHALEEWIEARHAITDDGLTGAIGGIKLDRWERPIPDPGSRIEPYVYRPLDVLPTEQLKRLYFTAGPERRERCAH